jgi:hypothetical protein
VPFLRVIRDRRGYEVTYLIDLHRDGARQRSRILYVFRTPAGVRVGRTALDPDTLRSIEAAHPDVAFDWKDVREHQQHIEMSPEPRRRRAPKREEAGEPAPAEATTAAAETADSPPAVTAAPPVPAAIQGTTTDEQVAFLAHWFPVICERIPRRTSDPVRQEALRALAERLNPAAWVETDQVDAGLKDAAQALERLSHVFSRRRRRARRRGTETSSAPAGPAAES